MTRGITPVVGVVLLVGITVVAAATVGLAASPSPPEPLPMASLDLSVDADSERISLDHRAGDTLDLTALDLRIVVDGEELSYQPPVPFFAARGFESGPTGPFNTASPNRWRVGQTATLELASTNQPRIEPGVTVTVVLFSERGVVAEVSATA